MANQNTPYTAGLFHYLDALRANNNREWFGAHRDEYDRLRANFTADLQRLIDTMAVGDPALRGLEARDCIYRIYRDTRFSPDKTPYKTYFSALVSPTGRHCDRASWYIHLGSEECAVYGGLWMPPSPVLRKVRKAIVDNIDEFRAITSDPEMDHLFPGWYGQRLKTAPQGYDRNHPEIELLRLKEYGKAQTLPRSFFDNPRWPEETARRLLVLKPLIDFLNYSIDE